MSLISPTQLGHLCSGNFFNIFPEIILCVSTLIGQHSIFRSLVINNNAYIFFLSTINVFKAVGLVLNHSFDSLFMKRFRTTHFTGEKPKKYRVFLEEYYIMQLSLNFLCLSVRNSWLFIRIFVCLVWLFCIVFASTGDLFIFLFIIYQYSVI